jgi:hypothetical protein
MSTSSNRAVVRTDHADHAVETKASYKTTEFYAWIIVSVAILVAAAMVDNGDDGQGFGADNAWLYVALVTVAYIISRGLAKSGSRTHDHGHDND